MKFGALALALAFALAACGGGSSGGAGTMPTAGTSQLSVAMLDAPIQLNGITVTAVNLGIDKVEAVGNGSAATVLVGNLSRAVRAGLAAKASPPRA